MSAERKNAFPVRVKMILLMVVAIGGSLLTVLRVVRSIFIDDKSSYILDYNQTLVRSAASSVEHQIERLIATDRMVHAQLSAQNRDAVKGIFADASRSFGLRNLLVLSLSKQGFLTLDLALGTDDGTLPHLLDQLGWGASSFLPDRVLIGRAVGGEMAVGTLLQFPEGGGRVYVALLVPDMNLPKGIGEFQILLFDWSGTSLFSKAGEGMELGRGELASLLSVMSEGGVISGARRWTTTDTSSGEEKEYLVAFQRLGFRELTVVGLFPEEVAFAAVNTLVSRSLAVSASIILIALGLTLVFLRRLTEGLRQMAMITEKVRQGSFNFRVDTQKMGNDEIGALAASFNAMADRIDSLMQEVEHKTVQQAKSETATTIQKHFLPEQPYSHANAHAGGGSLAGAEVAGDWWHYETVGDFLILVLGMIEGEGVSKALLTAAAHGAVSSFAATSRLITRKRAPFIKLLASDLNYAIYAAAKGKQTMRSAVVVMDTHSGKTQVVNAGLPAPILHRIGFGGRPDKFQKRFSAPVKRSHAPLGSSLTLDLAPETIQLKKGDVLFFYTEGALKRVRARVAGQELDPLYQTIADLYDAYETQADRICAGVIEVARAADESGLPMPKDATVAAIAVPKKAYFMEREGTPPAPKEQGPSQSEAA